MVFWNALYFHRGAYVPNPAKSAEWNRGAYLVTGPGHCGDCHTPKNWLYADKAELALTGNIIENWWAADLTADPREGLSGWSKADIVDYLKTGRNEHLMVAGPMAGVVAQSTSKMHDDDVAAIAAYLKDQPPRIKPVPIAEPSRAVMAMGRTQFRAHCQDCHNYDGTGVPRRYPTLDGAPTVQSRDPTTVIRIVLSGQKPPAISARPDDKPMPAFAEKMNDEEIAAVATYVRNSWGNRAPPVSAKQVSDLRKKLAQKESE
jgi:mono/diheme cytochrome c family protein